MRVLVWHVHSGWMDAFVRGPHEYLLPVDDDGNGGKTGYDWPEQAIEVPKDRLRDEDVDVVVLQRLEDIDATTALLGRTPGKDVPAVFVEHNTPKGDIPNTVHPLADQEDILIAHVTYFNQLFWDNGRAPNTVIEHGIVDRGELYTGELPRIGAVINEPVRRWRVTGSDLLGGFSLIGRVDVFGMQAEGLAKKLGVREDQVAAAGDLPTEQLFSELAKRRLYLHPARWTSLGLSLLEAMHLGMPVVAVNATEIGRAVPPEVGFVSDNVAELHAAARRLLTEPERATEYGKRAREFALTHYSLDYFLERWSQVLEDQVEAHGAKHGTKHGTKGTTHGKGRTK